MSGTELAAILTATFSAFGTLLYGFYKYAQARERDFEKSRQIMAAAYDKSNRQVARSLNRVASATERAADEAKERNGHLAELQIASQELILNHNKEVSEISSRVIKNIQNIKEQHVETQTVQTATIVDESVEHKEERTE